MGAMARLLHLRTASMTGAAMTKFAHFGEISRKPVSEMVTRTRIDNYMNRRVFLANFMRYVTSWEYVGFTTRHRWSVPGHQLLGRGYTTARLRSTSLSPSPCSCHFKPCCACHVLQTPHILPISVQHRAPGSNRFTMFMREQNVIS